MKNSKKKVLGISLLSLLACGILFAGTTYAWYADQVTVKENQLQAGSLKVDLSKYNVESSKYESFRDNGSLKLMTGENSVNWEPGKTAVAACAAYIATQNGYQVTLMAELTLCAALCQRKNLTSWKKRDRISFTVLKMKMVKLNVTEL